MEAATRAVEGCHDGRSSEAPLSRLRPFPFQHPQLGDRWARRTRWQGFPGLGDVHDEAIIVPVERPTAAPPSQLIRIVRSASLCPPARPQVVADVVRPQRGPADRS